MVRLSSIADRWIIERSIDKIFVWVRLCSITEYNRTIDVKTIYKML